MADSVECIVTRSSGREPPCDDCEVRRFQRSGVRGQGKVHCMTFASFDALTAWLRVIQNQVVVSVFHDTMGAWVDGKPPPNWNVEIYDDYRE
jgi:hypothetical protein